MIKKMRKGFTLIELLVVIAIIALLSTLAVVALNSARAKARDAKRVSDVKQLMTALALYSTDNTTSAYPFWDSTKWTTTNGLSLTTALAPVLCNTTAGFDTAANCSIEIRYMIPVPNDPTTATGAGCQWTGTWNTAPSSAATCNYAYRSGSSGVATGATQYELMFYLEGAAGSLSAGAHCASEAGINTTAAAACNH